VILVGSRKASLRQGAADRAKALTVARSTREGLEVADTPVAADVDAANEHLAVIRTGMPAAVTERRTLAPRADLKRSPRARKFVAAVSAQAEHATGIGTLGAWAEIYGLASWP
jgi:hypothetical protein